MIRARQEEADGMAITQTRLSLEEFLRLPEEEPALEYEDGVVTQKMSPKGKHSRTQYRMAELFNRVAEPARQAIAFPELRATFGGRSYVPDVAVYRWERIPVDEKGQVADDFQEPPDIAVEIVSPGQSATALVRRCLWYVDNGVQVALLVDPEDESILVLRPGAAPQALRGGEIADLKDVLPGFALVPTDVFDVLRMR
jgi:Uma2 family endonuclease